MKLRIVSGFLGRRYITIPKQARNFRPTLEKNRSAIADSIQARIGGASVADMCSGSGAFGFEMLSRGAAHADFVEIDRERSQALRDNARLLGVEPLCGIFTTDIRTFLKKCSAKYDIVFFDPPYDDTAMAHLVPSLTHLLSANGILISERRKQATPDSAAGPMTPAKYRSRTYGDTVFDMFIRCEHQ
jgi:16S rRNA (guanine966-N2)-methyltransferase